MTIRKISICATAAAIIAGVFMFSCDGDGRKDVKFDPTDEVHQRSYVVGRSIGFEMRDMNDPEDLRLDIDVIVMAVLEAFEDAPARLPDTLMADVDVQTKRQVRELRNRRHRERVENNARVSREFLEANAQREGVITTESGLQYTILQPSEGPKPTTNDKVTVHYRGTFIDGRVFDESFERGEPITFAVTGVIRGWTEGLQLMSVGAIYRFFIPPELAYGATGAGARIPPNTALIFDVALLEISQ